MTWELSDKAETAVRFRVYMAAFGGLDARGATISRTDEKLRDIVTWEASWLDKPLASKDSSTDAGVDVVLGRARPIPQSQTSNRQRSADMHARCDVLCHQSECTAYPDGLEFSARDRRCVRWREPISLTRQHGCVA
jgi:hypothetical protein